MAGILNSAKSCETSIDETGDFKEPVTEVSIAVEKIQKKVYAASAMKNLTWLTQQPF